MFDRYCVYIVFIARIYIKMYGFITEKFRNAVDRRCGFFCYARKISGLIVVLDSLSR